MASNQLPDSIYDLFTLAEDLTDGAHIRGGGLVLAPSARHICSHAIAKEFSAPPGRQSLRTDTMPLLNGAWKIYWFGILQICQPYLFITHNFQTAFGESQRDSGLKPRVVRHELPWEKLGNPSSTPTGLLLRGERGRRNPVGVGTAGRDYPR